MGSGAIVYIAVRLSTVSKYSCMHSTLLPKAEVAVCPLTWRYHSHERAFSCLAFGFLVSQNRGFVVHTIPKMTALMLAPQQYLADYLTGLHSRVKRLLLQSNYVARLNSV